MKSFIKSIVNYILVNISYWKFKLTNGGKSKIDLPINLCSGDHNIPGFLNLDYGKAAEVRIDLIRQELPFKESSVKGIVMMSAINYFEHKRAEEILKNCSVVLQNGGVIRIGVQDLDLLVEKFINKDRSFFEQKVSNGQDRFPGRTLTDRFVSFFYGYFAGNSSCKYIYNFESLKTLLETSGFTDVTRCNFKEAKLMPGLEVLDNRPEQMFFVEAKKKG